MPQATLRVLDGVLKGKAYPIAFSDLKIGRSPECKIRPPQEYLEVSRVHARLYWNGKVFVIEDQGSRNGVQVDGKRVESRQLSDRDVIHLGDFVVELRLPSGPPEFPTSDAPPPVLPPAEPAKSAPKLPSYAPAAGAIALLALVIFVVSMRSGSGSAKSDTPPKPPHFMQDGRKPDDAPPPSMPESVTPDEATLKKTKDAVVFIVRPVTGGGIAMGSGFCVGDGRTIMTNRHVVTDRTGANSVTDPLPCIVIFFCGTSHQIKVEVPAENIQVESPNDNRPIDSDLALMQLPEKVVEPLSIGDTSALSEVQRLWVVGFPLGITIYTPNKQLPAASVQEHTVERLQRDAQNRATMLQMGGSATHGNSGGPVINAKGEVVGVLVAGASDSGSITYAIPSDNITELLQTYADRKHHVRMQGVSVGSPSGGGE